MKTNKNITMKNTLIYFTFLLSLILTFSCKDDKFDNETGNTDDLLIKKEKEGMVAFSFAEKAILKNTTNLDSSINAIVITIEDQAGTIIYDNKEIPLYKINGNYITNPLNLLVNQYKITKFIIIDQNKNALYATPIEGSEFAKAVSDALPIDFVITKNDVSKVVPDVISTTKLQPQDFGYATFSFNLVEFFEIEYAPMSYNNETQNYELETFNLTIEDTLGNVLASTEPSTLKGLKATGYPVDFIGISHGDAAKLKESSITPPPVTTTTPNPIVAKPVPAKISIRKDYDKFFQGKLVFKTRTLMGLQVDRRDIIALRDQAQQSIKTPISPIINSSYVLVYTNEFNSRDQWYEECDMQNTTLYNFDGNLWTAANEPCTIISPKLDFSRYYRGTKKIKIVFKTIPFNNNISQLISSNYSSDITFNGLTNLTYNFKNNRIGEHSFVVDFITEDNHSINKNLNIVIGKGEIKLEYLKIYSLQ